MTEQEIKKEFQEPALEIKETAVVSPLPPDMATILEQRKQQFDQFVANAENRSGAVRLAKGFYDLLGGKWFTLDRACVKTGMGSAETYQKLKVCEMFGLCQLKKGDSLDKKERGTVVFKLTLDQTMELRAIEDVIKQLQQELQDLELRRKVILANQAEAVGKDVEK